MGTLTDTMIHDSGSHFETGDLWILIYFQIYRPLLSVNRLHRIVRDDENPNLNKLFKCRVAR